MHRILLVDDHELIIDGLRNMLLNTDLLVVGDARNGDEAIEKASELLPDVIIMDVSMPQKSGIEATGIIKKQFPDIKILVLTQHESNDYIMQMLKAGADGYLLKNCKKSELIEAIQNVLSDEKHLGKGVSSILMDSLIKSKQIESERSEEVILTPREKEIIKLIATDISNKEIADMLNISLRTVETHRRNIMLKLNVNNAVALVRYAVKHGIVGV
jgi:DNA-binding NarL/FixJ family response regulator